MEDPASRPELRHTCPACNRPVTPGYKFCEKCGTRIPSLYTCSKCGTQFIQPKKFCDLCGARFPDEEQGPDAKYIREPDMAERPEPPVDEDQGPDEEELPEPDQDEIPQPDPNEVQGPDEEPGPDAEEQQEPDEEEVPEPEEETPGPAPEETTEEELAAIFRPKKKKKVRPARQEIREPDTAELLEKYGSDEEEESRAPPITGWRSWFRRKEPPPKNADEALFLPEERPAGAARIRSRKNRALKVLGAAMVAIAVIAAFTLFGLPFLAGIVQSIGSPGAEETPVPGPTVTEPTVITTVPTTAAGALVPRPTQTIPDHMPDFRVYKSPVTYQITVIFVGSSGEGGITRADVTVIRQDGSRSSQSILPLKGIAEVNLNGSKKPDRVQIDATVAGGVTYHVYDRLLSPGDGI